MTDTISKSQIDKLGERLRSEQDTNDDLVMLDEYRRSFAGAYEATVGIISDVLELEPTGRPSKSTKSIREKLRRESIRLSQIQDIAGCRIVVLDTEHQETSLSSLVEAANDAGIATTVLDRRAKPSYGYRAVHVIYHILNRYVEIQIRTELQHVWAQLSEKLSDMFDPAIKYGGGDPRLKIHLERFTDYIAEHEADEEGLLRMRQRVQAGETEQNQELFKLIRKMDETRVATRNALSDLIADIIGHREP